MGGARSAVAPPPIPVLVGGLVLLVVILALWVEVALDLLLLVVALCVALMVSPDRRATWGVQAALIASLAVAMVLAGWSWVVVVAVTAQVAVVVALADGIAQRLSAVRATEVEPRRAAERRGSLLAAVRDLPRGDVDEAEAAAVRALRALAFDAAGVARVEGDELVARALDGLEPLEVPLRRGEGVAWKAIAEDRTLTLSDYERTPDHLDARRGIRGLVVAPIRVAGRPTGVLVGAHARPARPQDDEVEVAEVMAAHLGSVQENQASLARQRLLLEQAAHLDRISQSLLGAVSEEVRDPLTILRLGAQLLSDHAADLDRARRVGLLRRVRRESDDLRLVMDTILDFSRYHARRADPRPAPVSLGRLLSACDVSVQDGACWSATVEVDLELVIPALRLLLASGRHEDAPGPPARIDRRGEEVVVILPRRLVGSPSSVLVQLVEQLLGAAGARLEVDEPGEVARLFLPAAQDALPREYAS